MADTKTNTTEDDVLVTESDAESHLMKHATPRLLEQKKTGVVNPIEFAKALGVRPQMIYNYVRDDRIKSKLNDTQKIVIPWREAVKYAQKYLNGKARAAAKAEAELAGEKA